ncbi:hypothetical protein [Paenibacillus terrae]|uniref:Uncharacterized protein n=1 Tax=Paenibacillus terrae TaxID=159743 RepID=A0A0D7WYJ9_9BACL|nr:hypothetical protein [Paenibacillus terrae]KJD43788.1 hypothetical protein QD47_20835 [Paenibacillus terrae]
MNCNNEFPDIQGINQLESGVLIHKYICVLAMINYGTPKEKLLAKKTLVELEQIVSLHINDAAFHSAIDRFDWRAEEVEIQNAFS